MEVIAVFSRMELISGLTVEGKSKMLLLVLDGLGGLPGEDGGTELESAHRPNLDALAAKAELGMLEIVDVGVTPGSGPGHLSLFGYDPLEFEIGRGILEALGLGIDVGPGDVCARGNFATWGDGDVVVDRRAGRIPTEKNRALVEKLRQEISEVEGARVRLYPGEEHRFVAVFSDDGLKDTVFDADPQVAGPMKWATPTDPAGERMAHVANAFIRKVRDVLRDERPANGCLLRGFSSAPHIPSLGELYKIRPVAAATYPMYKGLARLVGMEILEAGKELEGVFDAVASNWGDFDYFYVHVKYTDSRGEDGDFDAKRRVVEEVDSLLPRLTSLCPDVIVITGDHSTPARLKAHSWHPVPFMLASPYVRPCDAKSFGERECARGSLGIMPAHKLMGLMLAHALRLVKFGA